MKNLACRSKVGPLAVFLLALGAAAASSWGGGGGSCGTVQRCGGDPTGRWKFTSQCADASMAFADAFCPGATGSVAGLQASGMVTFNADMTYSVSLVQTGTISMTIPTS